MDCRAIGTKNHAEISCPSRTSQLAVRRIDLVAELLEVLEFVEERAAADAEGFGGFGAVEVVVAASAWRMASRSTSSSCSALADRGGARSAGGLADARGKMLGQDEFAAGKQHGPLHGVAQFAHVARPGIALQTGGDRLRKSRATFGEFRNEQCRPAAECPRAARAGAERSARPR